MIGLQSSTVATVPQGHPINSRHHTRVLRCRVRVLFVLSPEGTAEWARQNWSLRPSCPYCAFSLLPAGKLTLAAKLTLESNRSKTESDRFFYRSGLGLICWHTKFSFQ